MDSNLEPKKDIWKPNITPNLVQARDVPYKFRRFFSCVRMVCLYYMLGRCFDCVEMCPIYVKWFFICFVKLDVVCFSDTQSSTILKPVCLFGSFGSDTNVVSSTCRASVGHVPGTDKSIWSHVLPRPLCDHLINKRHNEEHIRLEDTRDSNITRFATTNHSNSVNLQVLQWAVKMKETASEYKLTSFQESTAPCSKQSQHANI